MKNNITNRMVSKIKPEWEAAVIIMRPPERVIVCPACGSPRSVVRVTRPERNITQRVCEKCGVKYAIRDEDTTTPQSKILPPTESKE